MSIRSFVRVSFVVSCVGAAVACGDSVTSSAATGGVVGTGGAMATAPTFAQVKAQILDPKCNIAGCHMNPTDPKNSLNMAVDAYTALLATSTMAQKTFVVPGDPASSYLLEKLQSPNPTSGDRMPIGVPLSDTEIAMINDWIVAGAQNN